MSVREMPVGMGLAETQSVPSTAAVTMVSSCLTTMTVQMWMNVQLEMGTFAEMGSASIPWGPFSVSATKAMRWLRTEEPAWMSMNVFQNLENVHQAPVKTWMGPTDAFVHLDTVYKMTSVKILMSVLKSQKSVRWAHAVTLKAASNVCVQMASPCPPLEEGAKICE